MLEALSASALSPGAAAQYGAGLSHAALLYRDDGEYQARVAEFIRAGLDGGEQVFVAVPGHRKRLIAEELADGWGAVRYADMCDMGLNPGRIIPRVRGFIGDHPVRRVRYVGEPVWPGRSAAELREAVRHEALVNIAFAGLPVDILCPYDAAGLDPGALGSAERTHPVLICDGVPCPGAPDAAEGQVPPECDQPLTAPSAGAHMIRYETDLGPARELVARRAGAAGVPPDRAADLVLAVSELAANTLRHAGGQGTLHVWQTSAEIICQIADRGWIADPLAGRIRRPADGSGHGLWLVHQVCDLVELRTGPTGTQVRVQMRLAA